MWKASSGNPNPPLPLCPKPRRVSFPQPRPGGSRSPQLCAAQPRCSRGPWVPGACRRSWRGAQGGGTSPVGARWAPGLFLIQTITNQELWLCWGQINLRKPGTYPATERRVWGAFPGGVPPFPSPLPPQFCPALGPHRDGWGSQKLPVASARLLPPPWAPQPCWRDARVSPAQPPPRPHCLVGFNPPLSSPLLQGKINSLGCPWQKGLARKGRERGERERWGGAEKKKNKPRGCSGKSEVRAEAFRQPGLECLTHTVTKRKYELQLAP